MARATQAAILLGSLALATVAGPAVAQVPEETAAQEIHIDLELEPTDSIGLDELATLSIHIEAEGGLGKPEADFELDNFQIAAGPSTSNSLRFVNGRASRSLRLTWQLQPLAVGTARVHSAILRLEERDVPLPEQRLDVLETAPARRRDPFAPSGTAREPSRGDSLENLFSPRRRRRPRPVAPPKVYLNAEVAPADPYVGEQVLYTLYLFTQVDVRSVNPQQLPDFKGFWNRVIPQPEQLRPKMIFREGERIGKVVLLQRALFPRRSGSYEIEPVEAHLAALMPDSSPFGSLLPRTREIVRASNTVHLDVRELPPPPAGYQGAVGQISLEAELTPSELEVGEAATLSLTLEGQGHFQGLPPPLLPELPGVQVFPPQQQSTEAVRRKNVSGERTWSFVLVPERSGTWRLPPIEVPYFDPGQERYQIASVTVPVLAVRDSASLAQKDGRTVELHPIRTAALPAVGGDGWYGTLPVLFALPWGLAAFVLLLRRRAGPSHRTERRRLLARLAGAMTESQPRRAAAEIEEAWREFLHDRWDLPRGSPSTRWGTLLAERGARKSAADDLVKLADDLHYLRYAPKLSSTEGLQRELIERSRKLARAVS